MLTQYVIKLPLTGNNGDLWDAYVGSSTFTLQNESTTLHSAQVIETFESTTVHAMR